MITDKQKEYLITRYNFKTASERNIKNCLDMFNSNIQQLKDLIIAHQCGHLRDTKHNSLMYRVYSEIFRTGIQKLWHHILFVKLYDLYQAEKDCNVFELIKDKKHNRIVMEECFRIYCMATPEMIDNEREYIKDNIRKENELLGE